MEKRFLSALLLLWVGICSAATTAGDTTTVSAQAPLVLLDIGHYTGATGAATPDGKITEFYFWYRYADEVKQAIEAAGYRCEICNRGNAPTQEPYATLAKTIPVHHIGHPDKNAARYPSSHHPDRVGSGVASADYGIERGATCMVFLHLNSSSDSRTDSSPNGLVLCNRYNGGQLARCVAESFLREVVQTGELDYGGKTVQVTPRYVDADRSASWMNALDDSGIPAAVTEYIYMNNRRHEAFLAQPEKAKKLAHAVAQGIIDWLQSPDAAAPRHKRTDEHRPDEGSFGYAAESQPLHVPGAVKISGQK